MAVKVSVPVAGCGVSLRRKRSKVADSPRAVLALRCLATGRMGVRVPLMGVGSDLKLRRLSTMPEWFSMAVDLPAGDDGEVELVGDAGVFEVVLPGVVALFAEGVEEMLGGGEGAAELPFVEEVVVGGEDLFVVGEVVAVAAVHRGRSR